MASERGPERRSAAVLVAGALLAGALGIGTPAAASPVAAPGDETKAAKLRLEERRGDPGKWARAEARLAADGEKRYFFGGANVSAPLSIQVVAEHLDVPVQVSLHRQSWATVEADGTTGRTGVFRFDGRAYGDVGIRLRAGGDRPTRATVLVWQGDPVPPPLRTVYAPPGSARVAAAMARGDTSGAGASGSGAPPAAATAATPRADAAPAVASPLLLYAILAALVVVVALLTILVFRRGRGKSAAALVVLGVACAVDPSGVRAQAPNPFDVPKELQKPPLDADKTPGGPKDDAPSRSPPKDAPSAADKPPSDAGAFGAATPSDSPRAVDPRGEDDPDAGSYRERIAAAEDHVRGLARQVAANRAELERLRLLVESDRDNEVDPDRFPPMPISCRPPRFAGGDGVLSPEESDAIDAAWENYEECTQCYREPLAEFERQLELYERLRVLYSDTSKFVTKVIAVGDQAAKPHYLLENAWAAQKTKIRVDFSKTQTAYDAKLEEFNGRLSGILDRIGECETELNANPMWRATSGTFFYHAMANAYKRTD